MSEEESRLTKAYEALRFAKMMRDKHAINKWKHRIKVLEKQYEKDNHNRV